MKRLAVIAVVLVPVVAAATTAVSALGSSAASGPPAPTPGRWHVPGAVNPSVKFNVSAGDVSGLTFKILNEPASPSCEALGLFKVSGKQPIKLQPATASSPNPRWGVDGPVVVVNDHGKSASGTLDIEFSAGTISLIFHPGKSLTCGFTLPVQRG